MQAGCALHREAVPPPSYVEASDPVQKKTRRLDLDRRVDLRGFLRAEDRGKVGVGDGEFGSRILTRDRNIGA